MESRRCTSTRLLHADGALVPERHQRHHGPMIRTPLQTLAKLAEGLRDDEIHVWQLDYQRQRGRTPLHEVLAAYLGVHADDITLIAGEHGRPSLAPSHDQSLGFNWSHSGDQALIAIGRHIQPGIDLERQRARPRALQIAQRYFTAQESARLEALPLDQRHAAFLNLWTAKEAVLKATGRGLSFGLDRLNILENSGRLVLQRLDGEDVEQWQLQRLASSTELIAALAWRGGPRQIRLGSLAIGG